MISIRDKCLPQFFPGLRFDSGMGISSDYLSVITQLETFQEIANEKNGQVALALEGDELVVAYIVCRHPDTEERWNKLGEVMYEMGAIEVSRNYRRRGIARQMIGRVLSDVFFEDKITFLSSFSWHWDLVGTGLTLARYRRMMVGLMEGYGFLEYYTNEPNVTIKEENIFMARMGSGVLQEDKKRFRNLRFGVTCDQLAGSFQIPRWERI
jgi:acetoin utilization protein AcuA